MSSICEPDDFPYQTLSGIAFEKLVKELITLANTGVYGVQHYGEAGTNTHIIYDFKTESQLYEEIIYKEVFKGQDTMTELDTNFFLEART